MYGISAVYNNGTSWSLSNGNTIFRMNSGIDLAFRDQGNWAHIAVTYNNVTGEQRVYLNGDERTGQVVAPNQLTPSPLPLYIGLGHSFNDRNFEGQMDDVGIWDRALDQCEISQLYHEQAIEIFTDFTSPLCSDDSVFVWSSDSLVQFNNIWHVTNQSGTQVFPGDSFFLSPLQNGQYNIELYYDTVFCTDTIFTVDLLNCRGCLVGDYTFQSNTLDSSNYNHHGNATGGSFSINRLGDPNSAFLFDGVNDFIEINNNQPIIASDEFTIIAGAQMLGPGGGVEGDNIIFQQRNDISNAPLGPAAILFYAEEVYSSNSTYRIGARKDGNGTLVTADFPAVTDTNWHCFAASLGSDDTLRLYLDNRQVAQTPFNQPTGDFNTGIDHVSLGTHSYANQPYRSYFNGKMDFVEVHDCYVDPLAVCKEWFCRKFEARVVNDSASFTECPSAPVSVDSIQFGTPPYSFSWSNGDTNQQTLLAPGNKNVTVTDSLGCTWADTFDVITIPKPQVTADTAGPACLNQNITLLSSDSVGFYQKNWTVTDSSGSRNFSGDTLQVPLREKGHHEVTLYYSFETCLDSFTFTFDLDSTANITANPEVNLISGCDAAVVDAVDLDGFPPFQVSWSNSDSGLTTTYDVGVHSVTLTDANGCTHIDTFELLAAAPIQIDTVGPACLHEQLTLVSTDTAGRLQKQWTITHAAGTQSLSGDTVQMNMPVQGNYDITLVYSVNNCTDSVTLNFSLDTVPGVKAQSEVNIFPGCAGAEVTADSLTGYQPVQLLWSNNDTTLSTLYDTGVHTVTLTDAGNCIYIDTFTLESAAPLLIDTAGPACINEQITLKSNDSLGLYQKVWSVTSATNTQSFTGDTLQVQLPEGGLYNVNLTYSRHNCTGTSSFSFSIDTVPGLQVITDVNYFPGCAGGPVQADQITGYQPVSIQWSNNDTGLTTLYDSGFHAVTLTDAGNCVYTDTFYVAADSLVPAFDTLLGCDEDTLIISVQGNLTAYQNIWNVTYPGGFTTFGGTSFQYPIPDTGDYHFELDYSKYGCNFSTSLSYTSTVLDLAGSLNYQTNYFPGCEGALISTDSIVGGRPFYSALWSNGDTNFFSYFDTGYHYFSVTDTVECLWADTFYVSPDTLSLLVRTEHQCPMDSIYLQTTDTVGFLNKYWFIETPDSSHIIPGDTLSYFMETPGNYHFNMVYEKYGCSDTVTYSTSPDSIEIFTQIDAQPNFFPGCAGALAGAISPQGEAPFEYLWSNSDTLNQTLYDTGTYSLYLTDNRGCDTTLFFTVTPDSLNLTLERIPGCGTDTLYIQSSDSAGLFSKSWSQTGPDGSASHTGDSLYIPVTDTGLFNFELTYEKHNCNRTVDVNHQKSSFLLSVEATGTFNYFPGCAAGEAEVINTNGGRAPYNYLWSNNDTSLFTLFDTGTHIVTVTDTLGCEAYDTANIQAAIVELFVDTVHLCPLDSIFLRSNDTASLFSKQWFITEPQGGTTLSGDSISYFLNTPGTYFFDFEYNRHGCSDTLTYSVEPDTLVTRAQTVTEINYFPGCNGAMVNIINLVGESPYQFNWSNQSTAQNALHDTGTHSVTVTDARNCTRSDTFNIQTDSLTLTVDTILACGTDTLTLISSDAGGNFQKWWNITTPDSTTMIQGDTLTFVTGDSGLYQFTFNYNKYNCTRTIYYEYDVVDMDVPRNILQAPANVCESDTFGLYIDDTAFVNTVEWHAPGGSPVTLNNADTFLFSFPQAGNYLIEAYTNEWCKTDTHTYEIKIHPIPVADLGPDTLLCEGDSFIINLQDTTFCYDWNNGDTTSFLRVLEADTYSVIITSDYCGFDSDDVVIDSVIPALVNLPPDSIMCEGDSLLLDAEVALGSYIWNTGDTTPQIKVHSTGIYSVTSTNLCRSDMDSIDLKFTDLPTVNLGEDTAFCRGDTLVLNARGDTLSTYVWTDQSTDSTFVVTNSGMYRVTATNLCGDRVKGIHVTVADPPDLDLGPDTILCPDDVHILDAHNPFAQNYSWNTGAESPQI